MKPQKKRGLLAGLGAVVTAAALVLSGASAAHADTINPSSTVNLNIVKLTTPTDGPVAATGQAVAEANLPEGAEPIAGVEFTVTQITGYDLDGDNVEIDLTTNAGWLAASEIRYDAATGKWYKGADEITVTAATARTGVTNGSGIPQNGGTAAFQGMPIGLYFVEETGQPAGVTPSAPFSVALPMTNPTDLDTWMYSVWVYPKNAQIGAPVKTVVDLAPYGVDENDDIIADQQRISFGIQAEIPRLPGATAGSFASPDAFRITDQLNAAFTPVVASISLKIADDAASTGTALAVDTHYTLANTGAGGNLTIDFTPDGLAALQAAASDPGLKVFVTIPVDVAHTASGDLTNQARVYPNQAAIDNAETAPVQYLVSNEVTMKWRDLSFTKVDESGAALEGAMFNVYLTEEDARSGQNALRTAEVESTETGNVTITGLRESNWAGGAALADQAAPGYISYWLAESTAPDGYELLAEPIHVVLTDTGAVIANADGSSSTTQLGNVVNVEKNAGFELPLTGGMGTAILTILGVGILAAVLIAARRRRSVEDAATE